MNDRFFTHSSSLCAEALEPQPYPWQERSKVIGTSPSFRRVLDFVPSAADSAFPVLITGESGTGKEVFARVVHYLSPCAGGPFVPLQCAAIPSELFENELFGHENGAFTGAGSARTGVVGEAENGTLFLDEIESLRVEHQAKLLRLIEEGEYRPVGSSKTKAAHVRIVTATNAELTELIGKGLFRQDLYYRIAVINLRLPPLRERRDDIPTFVRYFLRKYSEESGKKAPQLTQSALDRLMAYEWPGNVRELAHKIMQAIIRTRSGEIDAENLDLPDLNVTPVFLPFKCAKAKAIDDFTRSYITKSLVASGWNVSEAARMAGLNRTVLSRTIHKLNITRPQADSTIDMEDLQ